MSLLRQTILETLSQRGPLPLGEIARAANHSPMATRYHLGLLVDGGLVVANGVIRRAIVGRPQVLYALVDRAHAHLPKQYEALAEQLLEEIQRTLDEKEMRALLRRAGRRLAETAPPTRRRARIETRLNHATEFLSARGYLARWEKSDDALRLWVCNCPYRGVALAHRQLCEMDIALIAGLLGVPPKMTHSIVNQNPQCVFVVKSATAPQK